ncbi:hypothetical protein Goe16_00420 [Bacillus phage vB_BsuM-Goe16]|nr:hypothetical protein Goe16_00420 [Bacillus phage vB_BsuM-Goe16]
MEIPTLRLRVVREYGEDVKPIEGFSYVMASNPQGLPRHHVVYGPMPNDLMDDLWFEMIGARRETIKSVISSLLECRL